ncbi:hypothetical protein C8Q78DRAFT_1031171 [Trametes maxima]|nr:hypothetical protein C8Q78DRAFT_1031171 [Trametes maxima]
MQVLTSALKSKSGLYSAVRVQPSLSSTSGSRRKGAWLMTPRTCASTRALTSKYQPRKQWIPRARIGDDPRIAEWSVRTLTPQALRRNDFIDLSDCHVRLSGPTVANGDPRLPPMISYDLRGDTGEYAPFPVNTRGFFYYHPHPAVSIGGSIRFRVVQEPDPSLFDEGVDLQTSFGTPWQMPLLALAHLRRYNVLREAVQREGLVATETLLQYVGLVGSAKEAQINPQSQLVYMGGEPFYIDLTKPYNKVYLVGDNDLITLKARDLFGFSTREPLGKNQSPFERGCLLCRFEFLSTDSKGHKELIIRVIRVVEPVRLVPGIPERTVNSMLPFAPREIIRLGRDPQLLRFVKNGSATDSKHFTAVKDSMFKRWRHRDTGKKATGK